ncbi:MAG: transposase [Bacteroidales bacterium]|mgnify:CR=1 FL=1|jgi:hypothetical protein|nr:transposase [Bacteroidales bacterium]NPV36402.1 transposase [Bacteroidales bacterium]
MIESLKNISPSDFDKLFITEEACLEFLAAEKWKEGYVCRKCGHTNYCEGSTPYSRRCTRCKHNESATAHTVFHKCHLPIKEAIRLAWLVCSQPGISSYELSRQFNIRQMTCWRLKRKVEECMHTVGSATLNPRVREKKD